MESLTLLCLAVVAVAIKVVGKLNKSLSNMSVFQTIFSYSSFNKSRKDSLKAYLKRGEVWAGKFELEVAVSSSPAAESNSKV
ncbi:hypothetical protein BC829DRAFT_393259 [Chytridium lagenaria]|nr:hypothetical protein BC829DRAFT_393259 [Chytridium lagenaria]